MSLQDQFDMGRIPIKPLPFENKDLASKGEIMIDHTGNNPSYHLYITDPNDETKIIDITSYIVKEAFGSTITVNVDGIDAPLNLNEILNFIYNRFIYTDNLNGFNYDIDISKVVSPDTKVVMLRNVDGTYLLPVASADSIFDRSGNTIQERLDSITRLGFANDYIQTEVDNQSVFEITYPFLNYPNGGNYLELRIGTVYVDKSRYQIIDNTDEDGNIYGATITFFNDTFEYGRRIDILYIYNASGIVASDYNAINGNQIASGSISSAKLEKTTDAYWVPDSTAVATGKALYDLYTAISDMAAGSNAIFAVDKLVGQPSNINVDIFANKAALTEKYIMLTILVNETKNSNISLNITHGSYVQKSTIFDITVPNGISSGNLLKVLVNAGQAKVLNVTNAHITATRYIYNCRNQEIIINFSGLSYTPNSLIKVYRNGVRLFVDLDYSINMNDETISLFVRTQDGERIVFEAEAIEY